jgi:Got1/Sft2-like family
MYVLRYRYIVSTADIFLYRVALPVYHVQKRQLTSDFGRADMIAFFSFTFFIELVEGNPLPFAMNYTFGHILQLLASTFLCGPKRQFK